jgi:hypothetical protein
VDIYNRVALPISESQRPLQDFAIAIMGLVFSRNTRHRGKQRLLPREVCDNARWLAGISQQFPRVLDERQP